MSPFLPTVEPDQVLTHQGRDVDKIEFDDSTILGRRAPGSRCMQQRTTQPQHAMAQGQLGRVGLPHTDQVGMPPDQTSINRDLQRLNLHPLLHHLLHVPHRTGLGSQFDHRDRVPGRVDDGDHDVPEPNLFGALQREHGQRGGLTTRHHHPQLGVDHLQRAGGDGDHPRLNTITTSLLGTKLDPWPKSLGSPNRDILSRHPDRILNSHSVVLQYDLATVNRIDQCRVQGRVGTLSRPINRNHQHRRCRHCGGGNRRRHHGLGLRWNLDLAGLRLRGDRFRSGFFRRPGHHAAVRSQPLGIGWFGHVTAAGRRTGRLCHTTVAF